MVRKASLSPARVGLRDIARTAGVSIGSVSSVLNNRQVERRIPPETAQKIRDTASQLGYLPNISARRLRGSEHTKNSVVLALVTSFEAPITLINPFVAELHKLAAAEGVAHPGYSFSVMIEMFSAGQIDEMPGLLTGDRFNAAIITNTIAADDQFLGRSHLPYPAIVVNRTINGYSSVVEEVATGARAAEVFVAKKRRRLAVLRGSVLTQTTGNRVQSFLRRSAELVGVPPIEITADQLSEDAGYQAMKKILKSGARCDGIYAVSDGLALGAYQAVKESGLRIPRDVAIIGAGDYDTARFFDPPLSCIGASHQQLAEHACRLLFDNLRAKAPPQRIIVPMLESLCASSGH